MKRKKEKNSDVVTRRARLSSRLSRSAVLQITFFLHLLACAHSHTYTQIHTHRDAVRPLERQQQEKKEVLVALRLHVSSG